MTTIHTTRAVNAHERVEDVQLARMWAQASTRQQQRGYSTELRTLDAVKSWYSTHDRHHPPSVREIAALSGVSVGKTSEALRRLHRRGLVVYTGKARGLWLP